ncbi:hypothetical protein MHBO_003208 [Bonamia ostreae]|uniref:Uncharacterized protein n=1 Tax=Bonamia ostreae TaxID=126728 RepID=A0ABV2APR6_9EUKA
MIAFCVCLTSSFFVITKLIFLENTKNRHLLLFALIFNWICLIFYFIFRRKDTIQFKRLYEASDSLELAEFSESVNSIPLLSKNDLNELLNKPKNKISHEKDRFLVAQKTNFEQFLKINGRIFCYKLIKSRFVNKKLTNLVFICGFLDFHNNWDHIAKKLSFNNKTKKIVILNLVAETKHGQNKNLINDQKLGKNYFQLSNKIINKLFDVLNIKTAIIVSRSIFAKNALSFALSNRERVKGLLMLSPCDRLPSFLVSAIKSKIGKIKILLILSDF